MGNDVHGMQVQQTRVIVESAREQTRIGTAYLDLFGSNTIKGAFVVFFYQFFFVTRHIFLNRGLIYVKEARNKPPLEVTRHLLL